MPSRYCYLLPIALLAFLSAAQAQNTPDLSAQYPSGTVTPITMPSALSNAQPSYIRTYIPKLPQTNAADIWSGSDPAAVQQSIVYKDGFNRPIQAVQQYATTGANPHLVQPFDTRPLQDDYNFLPYPATDAGYDPNMFTRQYTYTFNAYTGEQYTAYGATRNLSTASQRAVKSLAPGRTQVGQDRGVTLKQVTNIAGEVKLWSLDGNGLPVSSGTYSANQLYGALATSADGALTLTYKTKQGRLIYRKVYLENQIVGQAVTQIYGITQYIYDDFGQLRFTLPPKASDASGSSVPAAVLDNLCFQYKYDARGRKISQKVPGKGLEEFVYDQRDRPIFYRDAVLTGKGQWAFTIYDRNDRVLMSGLVTTGEDRSTAQDYFDNPATVFPPGTIGYYQNDYELYNTYPSSLSGAEVLTQNYYDNYQMNDPNSVYWNGLLSTLNFTEALQNVPGIEQPVRGGSLQGRLTGSRVRILPAPGADPVKTGTWRMSCNWYDAKGRMVYNAGYDLLDYYPLNTIIHYQLTGIQYDFLGRVHLTKRFFDNEWSVDGTLMHTELNRNYYDANTGRLTENWRKTDNGIWIKQGAFGYDALGRVSRKVLGNYGEVQDYSFNIRGQLTGINEHYTKTGDDQGVARSFGQLLRYDYGFSAPRYDGKIAGMVWRGAGSGSKPAAYGYSYDFGGRLTLADYSRLDNLPTLPPSTGWVKSNADYTVSNLAYDLDGNIKTMNQKAVKPGTGIVDMDLLTYTYENNGQSNRLAKVVDNASFPDLGDFNNTNGNNTDYSYDPNGNLNLDNNKGISAVTYTHFNKPQVITFTNGGSIRYSYDATGNKVQELVTSGAGTKRTDYISGCIYENDNLKYILTPEGRSIYIPADNRFKEEYFVKDHLDNVRSTVDVAVSPIEEYLATYEVASANLESLFFDHLNEVRAERPGGTSGDMHAGALYGSDSSHRVGTSMLMKVMAGDQVEMNVNNYYRDYNPDDENPVSPQDMLASIISTLTGGIGGIPGESHDTKLVRDAFNTQNAGLFGQVLQNMTDEQQPRAYLNYLMFDENLNLLPGHSGAFQANGNSTWTQIGTTMPMIIPANGYLAVYLSNASQSLACDECSHVYFDQLVLRFSRSSLKEEAHYYPHGLPMAAMGSSANGFVPNKHKYQSNELTKDLDLNWMDFHARQYDPQIGRFLAVDPLAAATASLSSYTSMNNNPVSVVDPLGLTGYDPSSTTTEELTAGVEVPGGKVYRGPSAASADEYEADVAEQRHLAAINGVQEEENPNDPGDGDKDKKKDGESNSGSVDRSTLNKNLDNTHYIGPYNPKTLSGEWDYTVMPINQADANAFIHDKEYDKEKASGLSGVLFNTKVLRADGKFIVAQMGVAFSRKTTVSEKFQAIVSGNIMTAVTMPKAFIYLGKYTINKFSMGTLFKP